MKILFENRASDIVLQRWRTILAVFTTVMLVSAPLSAVAQGIPADRPYSAGSDNHKIDKNYYAPTEEKSSTSSGVVLKGEVTYCVPKGTPIKLKLATVPTSGLRLMDRTFDGDLQPAKLGQKITAKTTEDIFVDTNRVIPEGTTFYGSVSKIHPPRRMARPGHLEIQFQKLKLPDGRVFAFRVEADNFKKSTAKSKAKGVGRLMAWAGGGAAMGAIVAYQLSGLQSTISMHGYNIAAGAAAGAIAATTYAAMKRGKPAVLEPGDNLNMTIDADLLMPVATKPSPKKIPKHVDGLSVDVLKSKQVSDGLGGQLLKLDLSIDNNTKYTLRGIDFYLEDSNGNHGALSLSQDDEESELNFIIHPYSMETMRMHFQMEFPKLKHKLVILDHNSRKPIHVVEIN